MNLTSIVGAIEVIAGVICLFFPQVSSVEATALIGLGLSTLGISQKVSNQIQGVRGIW